MPRFVPRQRKHKVRAREQNETSSHIESNQEQIIPLTQPEKAAKRQALRDELRAQQPKISAKKQKRLDKYIDNKLRKDETLDLLRKLEQEKEKYDAVIEISKKLGKRSFGDFVDGQVTVNAADKRWKGKKGHDHISDVQSEDSFEAENQDAFAPVRDEADSERMPIQALANATINGSGLAQALILDEHGLPIIQSRRRKKHRDKVLPAELPWEGFDSDSAGEVDSSDDNEDSEDSMSSEGGTFDTSEEGESTSEASESGSESSENSAIGKPKTRKSAFKTWASQQLNQSIGYVPSYASGEGQLLPKPAAKEAQPPAQQNSGHSQETAEPLPNRKAYTVHVERSKEIQKSRTQLPILEREQEIMEAIHNHPVVLVKGDTGSGKTTQIPQFLFEAGYGTKDGPTPGMIGITQPRRVAAVSMAKRVGVELGDHGEKVSYQIRFDSNVSSDTAVKFMTDGILLRELSQDLLLKKYSVIVIDEAHERSVNTDILIGMLSKIVSARVRKTKFNPDPKPLKLIIMSATLNIGDFLHEKLFSASERPLVVEAEGRQHRVTPHFALRSRPDYVEEVIEKVGRAHRKLPQGGILVFLTGQNEIRQVGDRLKAVLMPRHGADTRQNLTRVQISASEAPLEAEDMDIGDFKALKGHEDFDLDILTHSEDEADADEFDISDEEDDDDDSKDNPVLKSSKEPYTSVHVLPLYSQLPTSEQLKVFEPPPSGSRLIVLATNVAETSLTIPGIRYVFDSGRSKERKYNLDSGVQSFEIDWVSKASAEQRAGRAGRTGPGHCWRLYTSAVFEQFFPSHAEPEILRAPAESVVLQLKGFAYPKPIVEFPFPTPPAAFTLNKAEQLLRNLGALTTAGAITDLGKQLSVYPLSPRLGKIMAAGVDDTTLVWQVLSLVAGLAVPEIFVTEAQLHLEEHPSQKGELYTRGDQQEDEQRDRRKQEYGRARATLSRHDKTSDAMKLFTAVSMYLDAPDKSQFCADYFLRPKAMAEISQLRSQLESIVRSNHRTISHEIITKSHALKLSSTRVRQLNIIAASGHIDRVAIRYDRLPMPPELAMKPRRAIDVPYLPLIPLTDRASASIAEKAVYIHPSSVLSRLTAKNLPEYIVYSQLQRAQAQTVSTASDIHNLNAIPKTRMFPLTPITTAQLSLLARDTALIEYGKPVAKSKIEDLPGTPKRRDCWVMAELKVGAGERGGGLGFGWPLPPVKVRQVLDVKSKAGWSVEEVLS
ncbi:uncharacterized protein A1O9_03035 [Exophiala aquamarina CBS 119918]|uniref:RNA helicase n=1 Tax=Exophiala aquamarina CBS 119918 TaxID=1182545 RepID=A0A072PN07_9EURO|nr:uncharacterized protein A1O9_03035 [Exophiala aquamarina CBS 119918]KEF61469.1 hypothetical protein A1O9_03035 [Exophiala aquamarina CBS 119918]